LLHDTDFQALALAQIARRCAQESDQFFQRQPHDPRFCYELLRRAILERDQQAWELIYTQYRALVSGWVTRHPAYPSSGEEVQFFVNCAFEKFWSALDPDKFQRFPDLKSLLRYLQMCVHSVIVDQGRATRPTLELDPELIAGASGLAAGTISQPLDHARRREFWHWLAARLNGEAERQVVYGSFFLALKPRELFVQYHDTFRDIAEVYRVKENVLARLRRDPDLKKFLDEDA
jgi:hypothetical protein